MRFGSDMQRCRFIGERTQYGGWPGRKSSGQCACIVGIAAQKQMIYESVMPFTSRSPRYPLSRVHLPKTE